MVGLTRVLHDRPETRIKPRVRSKGIIISLRWDFDFLSLEGGFPVDVENLVKKLLFVA